MTKEEERVVVRLFNRHYVAATMILWCLTYFVVSACSSAQRAAESVPLEDRLRAEAVLLHTLCIELPDNAAPDLRQLCAMFTDGDGPVSGDGGPAPILEERKPSVGPGEGQGVRSVGGSAGR